MFAHPVIREAVSRAHGAPVKTVFRVEEGQNHGYRIAFRDGDELFLKVGTRFPERFPAEPKTMELVRRETELPVPGVRATGTEPLGYPFAVYDYVDGGGIDWLRELPVLTAERLCREAGRYLSSLHRITFPRYGPVGVDGDGLAVVRPRAYGDMLRETLDRRVAKLRETPFADRRAALGERGNALIDEVNTDAVRPALVHGDYRLDNLRIDPDGDRVTVAVLDWELPTAFDPAWDVAMTLTMLTDVYGIDSDDRRSLRRAFLAEYGEVPTETPRWRCYELLARVRIAGHLDAETRELPEPAVSTRVSELHDAFDDLLDGAARIDG